MDRAFVGRATAADRARARVYGSPRLIVPTSKLAIWMQRRAALAKALLRAKEKLMTVVTITQSRRVLQSVDKIMILHQRIRCRRWYRDEIIHSLRPQSPTTSHRPPLVS